MAVVTSCVQCMSVYTLHIPRTPCSPRKSLMHWFASQRWLVDGVACWWNVLHSLLQLASRCTAVHGWQYRCTGLLQLDLVYNLQLFQQACEHTGLQLVSACDCFAFCSWDTTLVHSCLYSALISLGRFLLLQLFLQLGDMFTSDCFLQVLGHILVTCILILHFLCEHLYLGTQLVNHLPQLDNSQLNYSESQKFVLRQETVCASC